MTLLGQSPELARDAAQVTQYPSPDPNLSTNTNN